MCGVLLYPDHTVRRVSYVWHWDDHPPETWSAQTSDRHEGQYYLDDAGTISYSGRLRPGALASRFELVRSPTDPAKGLTIIDRITQLSFTMKPLFAMDGCKPVDSTGQPLNPATAQQGLRPMPPAAGYRGRWTVNPLLITWLA